MFIPSVVKDNTLRLEVAYCFWLLNKNANFSPVCSNRKSLSLGPVWEHFLKCKHFQDTELGKRLKEEFSLHSSWQGSEAERDWSELMTCPVSRQYIRCQRKRHENNMAENTYSWVCITERFVLKTYSDRRHLTRKLLECSKMDNLYQETNRWVVSFVCCLLPLNGHVSILVLPGFTCKL